MISALFVWKRNTLILTLKSQLSHLWCYNHIYGFGIRVSSIIFLYCRTTVASLIFNVLACIIVGRVAQSV